MLKLDNTFMFISYLDQTVKNWSVSKDAKSCWEAKWTELDGYWNWFMVRWQCDTIAF